VARVCAGRTARAVSDAVGTARRNAEVAGTPRERVAIHVVRSVFRPKTKEGSDRTCRVRTEMLEGHGALFWIGLEGAWKE
jgi:hypothetical protein